MENKYFIKECTLIPTEGSSLSQPFEISGGNPTITYFESVKSPSISMTITFLDVDQLISREGITGGEYIALRVTTGDENQKDFEIDPDNPDSSLIDLDALLLIFINGVVQIPGESYTFDGGSSLEFIQPPDPNDIVDIYFYIINI